MAGSAAGLRAFFLFLNLFLHFGHHWWAPVPLASDWCIPLPLSRNLWKTFNFHCSSSEPVKTRPVLSSLRCNSHRDPWSVTRGMWVVLAQYAVASYSEGCLPLIQWSTSGELDHVAWASIELENATFDVDREMGGGGLPSGWEERRGWHHLFLISRNN